MALEHEILMMNERVSILKKDFDSLNTHIEEFINSLIKIESKELRLYDKFRTDRLYPLLSLGDEIHSLEKDLEELIILKKIDHNVYIGINNRLEGAESALIALRNIFTSRKEDNDLNKKLSGIEKYLSDKVNELNIPKFKWSGLIGVEGTETLVYPKFQIIEFPKFYLNHVELISTLSHEIGHIYWDRHHDVLMEVIKEIQEGIKEVYYLDGNWNKDIWTPESSTNWIKEILADYVGVIIFKKAFVMSLINLSTPSLHNLCADATTSTELFKEEKNANIEALLLTLFPIRYHYYPPEDTRIRFILDILERMGYDATNPKMRWYKKREEILVPALLETKLSLNIGREYYDECEKLVEFFHKVLEKMNKINILNLSIPKEDKFIIKSSKIFDRADKATQDELRQEIGEYFIKYDT